MTWPNHHANPNVLYATPAELATYIAASAPDNAVPLLRWASGLVREAISGAHYAADDTTGLPTYQPILDALRNATCAQAAAAMALNIDPLTGGVPTASGSVSSKTLDGASVTYADGSSVATARAAVYTSLVPDAVRYLDAQGLGSTRVWIFG